MHKIWVRHSYKPAEIQLWFIKTTGANKVSLCAVFVRACFLFDHIYVFIHCPAKMKELNASVPGLFLTLLCVCCIVWGDGCVSLALCAVVRGSRSHLLTWLGSKCLRWEIFSRRPDEWIKCMWCVHTLTSSLYLWKQRRRNIICRALLLEMKRKGRRRFTSSFPLRGRFVFLNESVKDVGDESQPRALKQNQTIRLGQFSETVFRPTGGNRWLHHSFCGRRQKGGVHCVLAGRGWGGTRGRWKVTWAVRTTRSPFKVTQPLHDELQKTL